MDANKYRTAYDKAQAVQHEVWTELCQHLEHAPDAQLLSDYTATLVYTLDKDRREEALRLLRGQLYSRQLRDTGRVESWFTDCGARMGQDIEGFVANARQQYVQAGLAEEQRAEAEAKQKAGRGRFRIRPASAFAPERAAYLVQPYHAPGHGRAAPDRRRAPAQRRWRDGCGTARARPFVWLRLRRAAPRQGLPAHTAGGRLPQSPRYPAPCALRSR